MKRQSRSPRRGDAKQRAMPNSEPAAEHANGQPAAQRAASKRRSMLWPVSLVAGFLVLIVLTCTTWFLTRDAVQSRLRLQLASANALLVTQQLDAVFARLWNHFPKDQPLSPDDRALLETWMRFDEKYVFDNSNHPQARFESATVHRRIGQGVFLLGDIPDALEHFRQAIDLFESLVLDQPTITSYRSELADAYVRMAWVLHAKGDTVGAEDISRRAIQNVDDAPLPNDPAYNAKCASIFVNLAELALLRAEHTQVRPLLERSVLLYRGLVKESPDIDEYRALLAQVEARLASTNQAQP